MKKIIFSLFLFLVIFLFKPDSSFASCNAIQNGTTCGGVMCSARVCCASQAECTQFTASNPAPSIGGGGGTNSDPTVGCGSESINTAVGCIPVGNTNSFVGWVLGWAVGIGGGIAFLLIVSASFMVMTSQGDPTRLKAGQELLTSAISGLIMLIFSVFILKFIGVDILGLSSFGFGK